jgi:hypothetical protein
VIGDRNEGVKLAWVEVHLPEPLSFCLGRAVPEPRNIKKKKVLSEA